MPICRRDNFGHGSSRMRKRSWCECCTKRTSIWLSLPASCAFSNQRYSKRFPVESSTFIHRFFQNFPDLKLGNKRWQPVKPLPDAPFIMSTKKSTTATSSRNAKFPFCLTTRRKACTRESKSPSTNFIRQRSRNCALSILPSRAPPFGRERASPPSREQLAWLDGPTSRPRQSPGCRRLTCGHIRRQSLRSVWLPQSLASTKEFRSRCVLGQVVRRRGDCDSVD